jgi:hypothetical protein
MAQYETFLGGGDPLGAATLTLDLDPPVTVPVTHTMTENDFDMLLGGQSPKLMIERCEFRASLIPALQWPLLKKGLDCSLVVKSGAVPLPLQLGPGGLVEGGEVYRFRLFDRNYSA